jgi:WD40 repeat protein
VEFAPDGKSVATASYDKLIKLWDVESGKEVRTLKDHIDAVYALAFTPDGKRLVSASADRGVKVWDVATGERLYTLSEPTDGLNTLALDPAGKRVAAGGLDRTIRVWSLGEKSGTLLNSLIAHEDAILQLAWSPDGKYLISSSADKEVKVLNADDLSVVKTWRQPDWALSVGFAPDGKSFAVGRFDGSYEIYNTAIVVGQAPGLHGAPSPASR